MLHNVQVQLDSGEVSVRMSEMRQWLDRNGIKPEAFEYRRMDADGVVCRVDFKMASEAAAFAEAGRVLAGQ